MSVYLALDSGLPTAHGASSASPSVIYQAWGSPPPQNTLLPEAAPGLTGSLDPDGALWQHLLISPTCKVVEKKFGGSYD